MMRNWKTWAAGVLLLAAARPGLAQTVTLAEAVGEGDCFRIALEMSLKGELRVVRNETTVKLPLEARASHAYVERLLLVEAGGLPLKSARCYESAQARITVDGSTEARSLPADHGIILAHRLKEQVVAWCPKDHLTRGELELVGEHLDSLSVTGLLPSGEVKVGDAWKVKDLPMASLCGLEALVSQDLAGKLDAVTEDEARISLSGTVIGIDAGAQVKQVITGQLKFDRQRRRLTALEWRQQDERDQGPASPASTTETTWSLRRQPVEVPAALADYSLVAAKAEVGADSPAPEALQLIVRDLRGRFRLACDRDWRTVSQSEDHLILRLVDRGDLVAQVTITPWTKAAAGSHLTPSEFKSVLADEPGWEPAELREDGEVPSGHDLWAYRVSALGELNGLKVVQTHYLVANARGEQVVLAFTLRPTMAEKLGTRDLKLVEGVEFEAPAAKP